MWTILRPKTHLPLSIKFSHLKKWKKYVNGKWTKRVYKSSQVRLFMIAFKNIYKVVDDWDAAATVLLMLFGPHPPTNIIIPHARTLVQHLVNVKATTSASSQLVKLLVICLFSARSCVLYHINILDWINFQAPCLQRSALCLPDGKYGAEFSFPFCQFLFYLFLVYMCVVLGQSNIDSGADFGAIQFATRDVWYT